MDFNIRSAMEMISAAKLFMTMGICLLFIILYDSSVFSQEKGDELKPKVEYRKTTCFLNSNSLQGLDTLYEPNDLIIIVSHLGKSEKKKMAGRRLFNARTFLSRMSIKARPLERIIPSKGEESAEEGYLDFFVKGLLLFRVYFPKNRDLLVQPCVRDIGEKPCSQIDASLYYPCKAKK